MPNRFSACDLSLGLEKHCGNTSIHDYAPSVISMAAPIHEYDT